MSATRLPGKVLFPVGGRPSLCLLLERVRRTRGVDAIVVATTTNPADAPIEAWGRAMGVNVFRGSEDDVMGRVLGAARSVLADRVVELTADNPLLDPLLIEEALGLHDATGADYVSNVLERTYPLGMDTQVFPTAVLADAYARTTDAQDREHVSLYIYRNPERYRLETFRCRGERWPELRLTLDTPADHHVIDTCVQAFDGDVHFGLDKTLAFFKSRPDLVAHNSSVQHNWVS